MLKFNDITRKDFKKNSMETCRSIHYDGVRAKDTVKRQRVGGWGYWIPLEVLTRVSRTRATSVAFHNKAELCSFNRTELWSFKKTESSHCSLRPTWRPSNLGLFNLKVSPSNVIVLSCFPSEPLRWSLVLCLKARVLPQNRWVV